MKLNIEEIYTLINKNAYLVNEANSYISRDSCGEYSNTEDLPALSLPGGDVGQLIALFAAANNYGFELDNNKIKRSLLNVINGESHFSFHSSAISRLSLASITCKYTQQVIQNPQHYNLTDENIAFIDDILLSISSNHATKYPKDPDVKEGAILLVRGKYGIMPRFSFMTDNGMMSGSIYTFQKTIAERRHLALSKKLVEEKAVTLYEGFDAEYLYTAIADTMDTHFFEITQKIFPEIPLFAVTFSEDGTFTVVQE